MFLYFWLYIAPYHKNRYVTKSEREGGREIQTETETVRQAGKKWEEERHREGERE